MLVRTVEWIWQKSPGLLPPASLPLTSGPRDSASFHHSDLWGFCVSSSAHTAPWERCPTSSNYHLHCMASVCDSSVTSAGVFVQVKRQSQLERTIAKVLHGLSALRSMWKEPVLVLENGMSCSRGFAGNSFPSLSHWIRPVPCIQGPLSWKELENEMLKSQREPESQFTLPLIC